MNIIKSMLVAVLLLVSLPALAADKLNLNTANAQQIANTMHGVGQQKAARIVDYRQHHGPFNNLDQLKMVKGIGSKTIEDNRDLIIVK